MLLGAYLKYVRDNAPQSVLTWDWETWWTPNALALHIKKSGGIRLEKRRWLALRGPVFGTTLHAGYSVVYLDLGYGHLTGIVLWVRDRDTLPNGAEITQ